MKPPRFDDLAPARRRTKRSPFLRQHGEQAKVLAGGQRLVPLLNVRLARPGYLVDLNGIGGLDGMRTRPTTSASGP